MAPTDLQELTELLQVLRAAGVTVYQDGRFRLRLARVQGTVLTAEPTLREQAAKWNDEGPLTGYASPALWRDNDGVPPELT